MKIDKTIAELIEGYNEGSLSREEIAWVEEEIKSDASFAEEIELDKQLKEIVVGNAFADLRTQMNRDLTQIEKRRKIKIATATVAAITIIGALVYTYTNKTTEEEVTILEKAPTELVTITSSNLSKETIIVDKEIVPDVEELKINSSEKSTVSTVENNQESTEELDKEDNVTFTSSIVEIEPKVVDKPQVVANKSSTVTTTPCSLQFSIKSEPTCNGEYFGVISVETKSVEGYTKPYYFTLNQGTKNQSGQFENLESGLYSVTMVDAQNCELTKEIEVMSKSCLPKEVSFNPVYGEKAELIEAHGEVKMSVFNRAGVLIYEAIVQSGNKISWSGVTTDGGNAAIGLYICVLQKEDQTKETVQITLLN